MKTESRTRSRRAGSPTSLPSPSARWGSGAPTREALLQTLDDVVPEGARLRIVIRDADIPGADVESDVPERGHHAVARILACPGLETLLGHAVDPGGRVVRVLPDQFVEVLPLPGALEDLIRERLRLFLGASDGL